jgi:hypothetical protein
MSPRKQSKQRSDVPEPEHAYRKPGVETSHMHIATMMMAEGKEKDAESLTRNLFPHLQKRVCMRPKRRRRT